jgi:nucleoside-diphosphate-sugar epimerase
LTKDFVRSPYSLSKDFSEKFLKTYSLKKNVRVGVMYFPDIYSTKKMKKSKFINILLKNLKKSKKMEIFNYNTKLYFLNINMLLQNIYKIIQIRSKSKRLFMHFYLQHQLTTTYLNLAKKIKKEFSSKSKITFYKDKNKLVESKFIKIKNKQLNIKQFIKSFV